LLQRVDYNIGMITLQLPETPCNASINRVQLAALPGLCIDAGVLGMCAYNLLSTPALIQYAREQPALALPDLSPRTTGARVELPRLVAAALNAPDSAVRAAAQAVAHRLGRNLGYILITLHRGDVANRAARPDWGAREWDLWAQIHPIWVGGGLTRGLFGAQLVTAARELLAELGYADQIRLARAAYGGTVALVGAARYLPAVITTGLCFDFGQTLIKQGIVRVDRGTLTQLHTLAPFPVPWDWENYHDTGQAIPAVDVLDFSVTVLVEALAAARAQGHTPGPDIMVSCASYIHQGRLMGNGLYARMQTLADNVGALIAEHLMERTGRAWRVHLIHDGAAAASVYAGAQEAAVIVIGTALGVGFPPHTAVGLRPLAADFTVVEGLGAEIDSKQEMLQDATQ